MQAQARGTRRRRARWIAGLALLVVAAVVVIVVVANSSPNNRHSVAGTTATGAATVQRRNLVATDTESGTLSYANPQTVYNRLSGTITWVPQIGAIIRAGQVLFDVDNEPVLLMNGSTPAYRELDSADTTGPDVYELNRSLVDLGYDPDGIVVDDEWQAATTAGIDALQYHFGETETGTLALGQVVFLPGPQMVQAVDTTVGSTGGGGGTSASYTPSAGSSQSLFVDYSQSPTTTAGTTTGTHRTTGSRPGSTSAPRSNSGKGSDSTSNSGSDNLSTRTLQALMRLIQAQQRELQALQQAASKASKPSSPSKPSSSSDKSSTGSGGGSAVAVLSTSSTRLVVTVDLSASSQSEATVGEHVTVEMPDGSFQAGRITAVSPVAESSSSDDSGDGGGLGGGSGSGTSTVPVTIELDKPARGGGLDQASVSVDFVQSRARNVLSVPVTALLATSGSNFAVQEAAPPHRLLRVHTGLFAAGYVAISGPGIHSGLKVTDSQG